MKIATKLAIALVLLTVTTSVLGTSYTTRTIKNALEGTISKSQSLVTNQTMDKVDRFLYERTLDLQILAGRDQIVAYVQQPVSDTNSSEYKRLLNQFNDFRITTGVWQEMTLLDKEGKIQLTTETDNDIASIVAQKKYQDALVTAKNDSTASTDVFLDPITNKPVMLFMTPVRSQVPGKPIIGYAVGKIAWATVLQILVNPGHDVTAHLLNSSGYVIGSGNAYNNNDELLVTNVADSAIFKAAKANPDNENRSGIFQSIDKASIKTLSSYETERGYSDYKGNHWILVFETPTAVAFAPSATLARNMIVSSVVITLMALIGVMWYSYHSVVRPIRKLRAAMLKIMSGDLTGQVHVHSRDEIGELGRAFNKMAEGLKESEHRLREEHARLTASINSLQVGFLMTDNNNEIVTINSAARVLLTLSDQDPITDWSYQNVARILNSSVDLPAVINRCLETWHIINIKEVNFDGRVLHLFAGPILTRSEDSKVTIIGCVILLEDVTETIIQARSKDEFFSIASHELRTPLTTIRGNSSMILNFYADILKDPSLKEMISDIHESSSRLIEIVNDFLDVSRIEQGRIKYTFTEVKLDKIIEKITYEMGTILRDKQLYLKIEPQTLDTFPAVAGDADRVKQVLYNLIGNAINFTEKGGVTVTVSATDKDIKVSVTDTGRGISAEGQKLLFRKFQQAGDSLLTRDTTKGTGLGLYISKLLLEGMGGRISLDRSEEGVGSTFAFTLPLASKEKLEELQAAVLKKGFIDSDTGIVK